MRRRRTSTEAGSVTALVVVFLAAIWALAGLVIDGGFILSARRVAFNEAEEAARAGAGQLARTAFRGGAGYEVDAASAEEAAQSYLARTGHGGLVAVDGDAVAVTVSFRQPVALLGLFGVHDVEVHATARARQARGVTEEEP